MTTTNDLNERPTWKSDGYRAETCERCGEKIGYAQFRATKRFDDLFGPWHFNHDTKDCHS